MRDVPNPRGGGYLGQFDATRFEVPRQTFYSPEEALYLARALSMWATATTRRQNHELVEEMRKEWPNMLPQVARSLEASGLLTCQCEQPSLDKGMQLCTKCGKDWAGQ